MLEGFIAQLAPHCCLVCGAEGALICEWCRPDAATPLPDRCYKCKSLTMDSAVCKRCRLHISHVWVRTPYADTAKQLVHAFKFERAKAAATVLADLLDEAVPYLDSKTVVTYVPTASKRVRIRGYDQARLIAQAFADIRQLSVRSLLVRHGQERQVGAGRNARLKQAANEYTSKSKIDITGAKVLLIDDIVTTGATIESVASVLRKAGARRVDAAIFAQK